MQMIELPQVWIAYYFMSLVATYKFLTFCKHYDIFNYEQLYKKETGIVSDTFLELKKTDPQLFND